MLNQKKIFDVVILGGGSIGLSVCYQLIHKAIREGCASGMIFAIVEPREFIGSGQAYEQDLKSNLLNTCVDTMSLVYEKPDHFLDWLKNNGNLYQSIFPGLKITPSAFVPRPLFGMYLEHTYENLVKLSKKHDISLTHIKSEAVDIVENETNTSVKIELANKEVINSIYAVISIGNLRSNIFDHLLNNPKYFNSPYPTKQIVEKIPSDASIAIIGTGLSAIDVMVALSESDHKGKIYSISRSGRLPSVRGNNKKHKLCVLTKETIDDLYSKNVEGILLQDIVSLLVREVTMAQGTPPNIDDILNSDVCMHSYLEDEIVLASKETRIWQSVIYATNAIIDHIWHHLAISEKRRFFQFYRSLCFSYRISFPLKNARIIQSLMRKGQLEIYGGLKNITYYDTQNRFYLELKNETFDSGLLVSTSYLIDATGFSTSVDNSDLPLIKNLLSRGLSKPCEFGGFQVEYGSGCLLNSDNEMLPRIYVLGSMSSGTYLFTNAMDVNARHAKQRADDIINKLNDMSFMAQDSAA